MTLFKSNCDCFTLICAAEAKQQLQMVTRVAPAMVIGPDMVVDKTLRVPCDSGSPIFFRWPNKVTDCLISMTSLMAPNGLKIL